MERYYRIIDQNIKYIINSGRQVAIYPMGMLGIYAKNILNSRYGRDGIYIDNEQCSYSEEIISFDELCMLDLSAYTVLICATKKELEIMFIDQCKQAGMETVSVRNPCIASSKDKSTFFENIITACQVKKVVGFPLVRVGKCSDGGYVMIDDFGSNGYCYSFGIGSEISWENDMAEKGFDIYCYDHTISHMPRENKKFHFFRTGIAGEDTSDGTLKSMNTILRQNGITSENMILKMDVEGAEWEFIAKTEAAIFTYFKQIVFELHDLTNQNREKEIISCLNKLKMTHQPVWIHANNAGVAERSGTYTVPEMLEITYVRKDSYKFEDCNCICPSSIDYPNVDIYNDIFLYGWGREE